VHGDAQVSDVDDLIAFLRAQLDEDERVAREAPGPEWRAGVERDGEPGHWRGVKADLVLLLPDAPIPMDHDVGSEVLRAEFVNDGKSAGRRAVDHAVRWDPARVLAEVEAKRRILDLVTPGDYFGGFGEAYVQVVQLLAQPYAGRDGWREEWRA
jgi:hypothetical protein